MSSKTFEEREAHIEQQRRRLVRLKRLVDIFHRDRFGDYRDTYEEFYETYLSPRHQDIPRYASCAEDETYGMIHLCETLREALQSQASIPSNGEYLNVPAGIFDLDCRAQDPTVDNGGGRIETVMITITREQYDELDSVFEDAIQYRMSDDDDEDGENDNRQAAQYNQIWRTMKGDGDEQAQ